MYGIQPASLSQSITSSVDAESLRLLTCSEIPTRPEGVMSRLGRWVRAINPVRLMDTPVNRAIRDGDFSRIVQTADDLEAAEPRGTGFFGRLLPRRAKVTYLLLDKNSCPLTGHRSGFQHFVDQIAAKFLKVFLRSDRHLG